MAPNKPKLVTPEDNPSHEVWNQYITEAMADVKPFRLPLPPPPDAPADYQPEVAEIACPDGDGMDALVAAQRQGNDTAAFVALFGEDLAPRLLEATRKQPFIIRAKLISDVMRHYGMQAANMGESSASNR